MKERPDRLKIGMQLALLSICVCGILVVFSQVRNARAQQLEEKNLILTQPGAEECLACHNQPGQSLTLPSGELLMTTISEAEYRLSIHGSQGFQCSTCHAGYDGYPHPGRTTETLRQYTIEHEQICIDCHQGQYLQLKDSVHFNQLVEGNDNAPVCSDCHNPHARSEWGRSPLEMELALTSHVCAQCHNSIFVEYAQSVHGVGLFQENNSDVPTCDDCHGIHSIQDPTTVQARLNSPKLCAECHTNPAIMDKYGISTEVLNSYIADFHGTTVTLFERINPDQETNKPVCYDCHGVHNIKSVDDPDKGIQIKENMLVTCQRCHPDATINLPDSWMSHYIPSPEHYPVVYYVQNFYKVFIPLVLGGMAFFVVTDIGRRTWDHLKGRYQPADKNADDQQAEE